MAVPVVITDLLAVTHLALMSDSLVSLSRHRQRQFHLAIKQDVNGNFRAIATRRNGNWL